MRCEAHSQSISIDDLRRLPTALVAIGSHSLTHAHLTRLKTADAAYELIESRRLLEEQLQRPIRLFSFPYGACNDELIRLCREAGYERIFTTLPESALSEPDEFVTGRVRVDPTDSRLEFRLKLIGAYRWLPAAFAVAFIPSTRRRRSSTDCDVTPASSTHRVGSTSRSSRCLVRSSSTSSISARAPGSSCSSSSRQDSPRPDTKAGCFRHNSSRGFARTASA